MYTSRPADVRARISEGQKQRWAERRRRAAYAGFVSAFYAVAGSSGDDLVLKTILLRILQTCPADERPRWRRYRDALVAGRRIKFATYPAEIFLDDERPLADVAADLVADEGVRSALKEFDR